MCMYACQYVRTFTGCEKSNSSLYRVRRRRRRAAFIFSPFCVSLHSSSSCIHSFFHLFLTLFSLFYAAIFCVVECCLLKRTVLLYMMLCYMCPPHNRAGFFVCRCVHFFMYLMCIFQHCACIESNSCVCEPTFFCILFSQFSISLFFVTCCCFGKLPFWESDFSLCCLESAAREPQRFFSSQSLCANFCTTT